MKNDAAETTFDIGGEGSHPTAWNVNPSRTVTFGKRAGEPIPRLIVARADAMPFATGSLGCILVERTPMTRSALREIARVGRPGARVVLRHVPLPHRNRHGEAITILGGTASQQMTSVRGQRVLETTVQLPE